MILFACEVAAGIWGFVNKDQVSLGPLEGRSQLGGEGGTPAAQRGGQVRLGVLLEAPPVASPS